MHVRAHWCRLCICEVLRDLLGPVIQSSALLYLLILLWVQLGDSWTWEETYEECCGCNANADG